MRVITQRRKGAKEEKDGQYGSAQTFLRFGMPRHVAARGSGVMPPHSKNLRPSAKSADAYPKS